MVMKATFWGHKNFDYKKRAKKKEAKIFKKAKREEKLHVSSS